MEELIIAATGLLTTITSWLLAKKKYKADVDHTVIENLQEALKTYDDIIKHNRTEIEILMKDNEDLRGEISDLRKQVLSLTLNICMDLRCDRRIREHQIVEKDRKGSTKGKLNSTDSV